MKKKKILIVLLVIVCILTFVIGYISSYRRTKAQKILNKNVLSEKEIASIEERCAENGGTISWDTDGYLIVTVEDDNHKIIMRQSHGKRWPESFVRLGLVPQGDFFGSPNDLHDYLIYSEAYNGDTADRLYQYIEWTQSDAEKYAEFARAAGFVIEPEYDNDFNVLSYMYSAKNSEGILLTIGFGKASNNIVSNITLTAPKGVIFND